MPLFDLRLGAGRLFGRDRWRRAEGQVISEYVTIVGTTAIIVIACMGLLVSPIAMAFVRLFRRMALYLTSTA